MLRTLFKSRQMETCGLFVVCEISVWANCNRDAWSGPIWGFSNNCGELCIARHVYYHGEKVKANRLCRYMQGGHIGGPSGCSPWYPQGFPQRYSPGPSPRGSQRYSPGCSLLLQGLFRGIPQGVLKGSAYSVLRDVLLLVHVHRGILQGVLKGVLKGVPMVIPILSSEVSFMVSKCSVLQGFIHGVPSVVL